MAMGSYMDLYNQPMKARNVHMGVRACHDPVSCPAFVELGALLHGLQQTFFFFGGGQLSRFPGFARCVAAT